MTKWLNSLVTVALIANIKVFATDNYEDDLQFEESGSDVGIEDFNSRQIHVDKPKDQGIITEAKREEQTKQYLNALDNLAYQNCSKLNEYIKGRKQKGNPVVAGNRLFWEGYCEDFKFDDNVIPAPCVLKREMVEAYLTGVDAKGKTGYDKLQYLPLEYTLILGNAIGKFEDTFTKTITHYNNTTPAENIKDSKYTMPEETRKLSEKIHNAETKEVLQASADDLWGFIEKGDEKDISQLSDIVLPNENLK